MLLHFNLMHFAPILFNSMRLCWISEWSNLSTYLNIISINQNSNWTSRKKVVHQPLWKAECFSRQTTSRPICEQNNVNIWIDLLFFGDEQTVIFYPLHTMVFFLYNTGNSNLTAIFNHRIRSKVDRKWCCVLYKKIDTIGYEEKSSIIEKFTVKKWLNAWIVSR